MNSDAQRQMRYSIAILALGGQGGGVLTDWIAQLGRQNGWVAQATSVAGVAQRTGSTVYYVELVRPGETPLPVMAQMPLPGDVDVVLASELMEAGRAILRGFVSSERTTLIGSTNRIYAISEKMVRGDGTRSAERILEAARQRSKDFIGFDMEEASQRSGSVISAVLFGALAGSGALPFEMEQFEEVIRASGIAVAANLKGFHEGLTLARERPARLPGDEVELIPTPTSPHGRALAARIAALPDSARDFATIGAARLMDYQDVAYAHLYLDRLMRLAQLDGGAFELSRETARHLALWMSYEDTIRVASLKIRSSRIGRIRNEAEASPDQIVDVEEFMHPRLKEICEVLPVRIGRFVLESRILGGLLSPFFANGRHVRTTGVLGFTLLFCISRLRRFRRASLRFAEEQARIDAWLDRVTMLVQSGKQDTAIELVRCQRLIKGYGDTFERGLSEFDQIMQGLEHDAMVAADSIRAQREHALKASA